MNIDYDDQKGLTVVPKGLFDYSMGSECIEKVEPYINQFGAIQITVDFCDTTFMDSSGIGALIILMRALPCNAPPIKLIHPSRSVHKLMEVCHLDKLFVIETDPCIS
jgi:anti-sigma B factor antagonist